MQQMMLVELLGLLVEIVERLVAVLHEAALTEEQQKIVDAVSKELFDIGIPKG